MTNFSSDHTADPMASVHRHPSFARWSRLSSGADELTTRCSSSGTSAIAIDGGDNLDAELRLLEAIARRGPLTPAQRRTITIAARGSLGDGRILWSGTDGTWGVIEPLLAEMMGWDASSARSVRADVHSASGRHQILAIHPLVAV